MLLDRLVQISILLRLPKTVVCINRLHVILFYKKNIENLILNLPIPCEDAPPPELIHRRQPTIGFYNNMNFIIILIITTITGITFLLTSLYLCFKNRK